MKTATIWKKPWKGCAVSTAEKRGISITAPPMEIVEENTSTIQYILFLSNLEVVHSMCDSPFSSISGRF